VLDGLKAAGISAVFHYVPLHSAPGGKKYARPHGSLSVTERQSESLIRLPLWVGLTQSDQMYVVDHLDMLLRAK
jgi:dTDP-4-amino-4,6-dideoxygalactose transaminase